MAVGRRDMRTHLGERTSDGGRRPRRPTPPIRARLPSVSTSAPSDRIAAAVASVSSEAPKPVTSVSPSAIAPRRSARWEIDLSPGTSRSPRSAGAGSTMQVTALPAGATQASPVPGGKSFQNR
jgi:hypothetical protein